MHPVFLAAAIYAMALLLGVAVLVLRHRPAPRRSAQLHPWMDLDGSARRHRQRTLSLR